MSRDGRERILDAAWSLLSERGDAGASLGEIAAAAGVSRQAVYLHFDNRAGLLTAMARRHDERTGLRDEMAAAVRLAGPAALERVIAVWCDYVPRILPVARALEAADIRGEEGGTAWQDRMRDLRAALRAVVRVLDRENALAEGWTVDTATDWLYARTHVSFYSHLVVERGWSRELYARRLTASLTSELVAG